MWSLGLASRRSRRRLRRARAGEDAAERLLRGAGYEILARQERAVWWLTIDGREVEVELRADFIVGYRGRKAVVEVKTGEVAPDPRSPATRRQLLEYALAFGLDHALVVDIEGERVHVVSFPAVATGPHPR